MNTSHSAGRTRLALAAMLLVAMASVFAVARNMQSADAHTPQFQHTCTSFTATGTNYGAGGWLTIKVNGQVKVNNEWFWPSITRSVAIVAGDSVEAKFTAVDDMTNQNGWSPSYGPKVKSGCATTTTTTAPTTTTSTTTSSTSTTSQPTTTTTTTAPTTTTTAPTTTSSSTTSTTSSSTSTTQPSTTVPPTTTSTTAPATTTTAGPTTTVPCGEPDSNNVVVNCDVTSTPPPPEGEPPATKKACPEGTTPMGTECIVPTTGSNSGQLALAGVGLLAAGTGLMAIRRRRARCRN